MTVSSGISAGLGVIHVRRTQKTSRVRVGLDRLFWVGLLQVWNGRHGPERVEIRARRSETVFFAPNGRSLASEFDGKGGRFLLPTKIDQTSATPIPLLVNRGRLVEEISLRASGVLIGRYTTNVPPDKSAYRRLAFFWYFRVHMDGKRPSRALAALPLRSGFRGTANQSHEVFRQDRRFASSQCGIGIPLPMQRRGGLFPSMAVRIRTLVESIRHNSWMRQEQR